MRKKMSNSWSRKKEVYEDERGLQKRSIHDKPIKREVIHSVILSDSRPPTYQKPYVEFSPTEVPETKPDIPAIITKQPEIRFTYFEKRTNRFVSQIRHGWRQKKLGRFKTKKEAAIRADIFLMENGRMADSNFWSGALIMEDFSREEQKMIQRLMFENTSSGGLQDGL